MRNLPIPGFRFYPTEEELVSFYLRNKLRGTGPHELDRLIPVLDIYDYNPFDLPHLAGERCPAEGDEWFFFIPRHEKEARGGRPNRLTSHGYWKATGSPGDVYSSQNRVIGTKRTMVFYEGRAPNGVKTEWKMNEYKAISDTHELLDQPSSSSSTDVVANPLPQLREEFSLCRIYRKSKYLRAYDRRPAADPAVRADNQSAMNQLPSTQRNNEATTTFNSPQICSPIIIPTHEITQIHTTLGECSFSGDHQIQTASTNPCGPSENSNTDVEMDSESFWDSEDFSWFDI